MPRCSCYASCCATYCQLAPHRHSQKKLAQASILSFGASAPRASTHPVINKEGSHTTHPHASTSQAQHPTPTAPVPGRSLHQVGVGKGGGGGIKVCQLCKYIDGILVHFKAVHREQCNYQRLLTTATQEVKEGVTTARKELEVYLSTQKGYGGETKTLRQLYKQKLYPAYIAQDTSEENVAPQGVDQEMRDCDIEMG
jgi:hypothetical protein